MNQKTFLLDLETNGLSPQHHQIISIGMLTLDASSCLSSQNQHYFITSLEEEKQTLQFFLEECTHYERVASFRGKGFDYPFLLGRLAYHGLCSESFLKLKILDMQPALRFFSSNRTTIEKSLGFSRTSESSGKDIIKLYKTYLTSPQSVYKELILQHQKDELESLWAMWELYQTLYHLKSHFILSKVIDNNLLILYFEYPQPFLHDFNQTVGDYTFSYQKGARHLTLHCKLYTMPLKHPLTPFKDYYYIESQNQLVHKSLASFIAPTLKRKAKKEECFSIETHSFVRIINSKVLKAHLPHDAIWYDTEDNLYIIAGSTQIPFLLEQLFFLIFHSQE